jgi:hypothetical protein
VSSVYQSLDNFTISDVKTTWGTFEIIPCVSPRARPALASLVFISYTLLAGYVIVNMSLATVAIGINERLEQLRSQVWSYLYPHLSCGKEYFRIIRIRILLITFK